MQTNIKHITLMGAAALAAIALPSIAHTTQTKTPSSQEIVVDEHTSDKVLLKGKDKEEMFAVAQPSTTLMMTIEGVEQEVEILDADGSVVLMVADATAKETSKITDAYSKVMKQDKASIEVVKAKDVTEHVH